MQKQCAVMVNKLRFCTQKGFSLVEILIVISIIGILSGVGLTVSGSIQKSTRDAQREADLRVLQSALQQYYADQNAYPNTLAPELTNGSAVTNCSGKPSPCNPTKTYLNKTPIDPGGTFYSYSPVQTISSPTACDALSTTPCHYYFLCANMENPPAESTCNGAVTPFNFQVTPL